MSTWSSSRQFIFGTIFIIIVGLLIGVPVYFKFFNNPPTCFDGKLNQNELGIDCGGICERACTQEVLAEPIQLWARAFKVTGGIYNLVAYVQNANVNYVAEPAEYMFRIYDKDNVLIGIRRGMVATPPVKSFPIFEQGFDAGFREIGKVEFDFNTRLVWNKFQSTIPELLVSEPILKNATTTPRIDAKIVNATLNRYENVEVVAIVYGSNDNAIAASRTVINVLQSKGEVPIVFTWPEAFAQPVSKIEIIPKLPI